MPHRCPDCGESCSCIVGDMDVEVCEHADGDDCFPEDDEDEDEDDDGSGFFDSEWGDDDDDDEE
jgi:hypothetical protein